MLCSHISFASASELSKKALQAGNGTPVVDGVIDSVWDKSELTLIDRKTVSGEIHYTGWMKVLWDADNLYVLAKIHTVNLDDSHQRAWNHDCVEVFVDENNAKTSTCENNDYQIRSNFKGLVSSKNYEPENVKVATQVFDMGYVVEMAFPMKEIKLTSGKVLGFDAQVYRTGNLGVTAQRYGWNSIKSDISSSTDTYGTLKLVEKYSGANIEVPEYQYPTTEFKVTGVNDDAPAPTLVSGVNARFDSGEEHIISVLHVNEYPCVEINDLAKIIGATVTNGNTITKNGKTVKYAAGERLLEDEKGHIIMQCAATSYQGQLYVPLSSLDTTFLLSTHYNRFDKIMDINPPHSPKDAELIVYAKDYGAVGDGVTDDREAIMAAFYAATTSGVPSRLELDEGKTYFMSECMDSLHMFWLLGVSDFTLDGNGSTLIFDAPMNNFISINKCARVKIQDLNIEPAKKTVSQAKIVSVDADEMTINIIFDEEDMTLPASEWISTLSGEYAFGQVIDPVKKHAKYLSRNHLKFDNIEKVGGLEYKLYVKSTYQDVMGDILPNDRMILLTDQQNYDLYMSSKAKWSDSSVNINNSGDIAFKNVNIYGTIHLAAGGSSNWGNLTFDGFNIVCKDGTIYSSSRDILHFMNGRGGILVQNCTFDGAGDDFMNTKCQTLTFSEKVGERTYRMDRATAERVGDEVVIVDLNSRMLLGRAFIEKVEFENTSSLNAEKAVITLDRDIEGIVTTASKQSGQTVTSMYNVSASHTGTVVRNNTFLNGRRHLWLTRSANSLFEDNYVENMNGSMVDARNENASFKEGAYPSAFTVRNNEYKCDGNAQAGLYPLNVESEGATNGCTAMIDGFLIEGNSFEIPRADSVIRVTATTDLYMINNTIKNTGETTENTMPVQIANSRIKLIDGLKLEYVNDFKAAVNIGASEYDEGCIKNIEVVGKSAEPFYDYSK